MTAVNYSGIAKAIDEILQSDSRVMDLNPRILIEEDPSFIYGLPDDGGRAVVILLEGRIPTSSQVMAAGTRTRYMVRVAVWSVGFSMNSFQEASEKRDEMLAQVELVLMANRTLNDTVAMQHLAGGQFLSASQQGNTPPFASMAETIIEAEVSAVNS